MDKSMMDRQDKFLKTLAQTNGTPYLIDVENAEGIYIYDKKGKQYMDMIAGVAVNNIGHSHPSVIEAIKSQVEKHMHVMVYGEYIQDAQLDAAKELLSYLPESLNQVYFVNSGTEAAEGALKLAKRLTGRSEIIAFKGAYHGSTHGALSLASNPDKTEKFRPLLPEIKHLTFNSIEDLNNISNKTAAVVMETIQGDAGVRIPDQNFMDVLRKRCSETGAQLILDEIQTGIGRTGKMFAFEHYNVVPDILLLGKALGGGMNVGAFVSSRDKMKELSQNPILGHITTFGGHPVVCAAVAACLKAIKDEDILDGVEEKGALLESIIIKNSEVHEIRRKGLMFAIEMESFERVEKVVKACLEKGLIGFWFLSTPNAFRLSPPLTITEAQIKEAGKIILEAIEETTI
ncbi:MAG: aspartate aminotransferase family protein [Crocinitomicaceae bacterium]|nr:aspartate aminotransferase family protein [Crocinitomicaceae bacterium]